MPAPSAGAAGSSHHAPRHNLRGEGRDDPDPPLRITADLKACGARLSARAAGRGARGAAVSITAHGRRGDWHRPWPSTPARDSVRSSADADDSDVHAHAGLAIEVDGRATSRAGRNHHCVLSLFGMSRFRLLGRPVLRACSVSEPRTCRVGRPPVISADKKSRIVLAVLAGELRIAKAA